MTLYELTDKDRALLDASKARRAEGANGMTREEQQRFNAYLRRKQARPASWEPQWESWLK